MKKILTKEDWIKIGREYAEKGPTQLGKELGVSAMRVCGISNKLRKSGALIPFLRVRKSELKEIISIINKAI